MPPGCQHLLASDRLELVSKHPCSLPLVSGWLWDTCCSIIASQRSPAGLSSVAQNDNLPDNTPLFFAFPSLSHFLIPFCYLLWSLPKSAIYTQFLFLAHCVFVAEPRLSLAAVLGFAVAVASPDAVRAQHLWCAGSVAPQHLPRPGFKLVSLPLASRLLITGPPGKSYTQIF